MDIISAFLMSKLRLEGRRDHGAYCEMRILKNYSTGLSIRGGAAGGLILGS